MHRETSNPEEAASWDRLSAYVDDELSPHEAADVAAAVARDPKLAERVATLSRLRAVTRHLPPEAAPPPVMLPRPRRRGAALLIAASLALAACLSLFVLRPVEPVATPDAGLSAAIAAHRHWIDAAPDNAPAPRVQVDLAAARSRHLPDLTASALELAYISLDPTSREGGLLAGYRGPHGCRLGLWMAPHSRSWEDTPTTRDSDGLRIRAWSTEDADYALLSRGMDPARLDRLADLIAKLIRKQQAPTEDLVAALREVPKIGEPCGA